MMGTWLYLVAAAFSAAPWLPPEPAFIAPGADSVIVYRVEARPSDIADQYSASQIALLEKLNRADRGHLPRLEMLVVPDRWDANELEYSPLPRQVTELADHPKSLVVYQPLQIFGAYQEGRLVRWGPVSSGRREHPTPSGQFHLNWRSRARHSTVDPTWFMEWYFNFHNERGLALHEYALPGRPASHACIRLLERDARWIYHWGEGWQFGERGWEARQPGTPLWIIGEYNFDAPAPWLSGENPHPNVEMTSLKRALVAATLSCIQTNRPS